MPSDRPAPRPAAARPRGRARAALARLGTPHDPLTSLVLTLPVFLVYHLGILAMDLRNGADLVSGLVVGLLQVSLVGYVALTLGVAVGLALAVWFLRGKNVLHWRALGPVLGESFLWAVGMWVLVGWATSHIVPGALAGDGTFAAQIGGRVLGPLERVVMAAGAGFHEELVFRAGLFGGLAALLRARKVPPLRADLAAAAVGALVFSAAHYVGPLGDAFSLASFTFRALSGLYLTALFRARGFAVAVYAHAIYDVLVFFLA